MRLVFICQAVDLDDPVLATTVRWLEVLANKPQVDSLDVITLRKGRFTLPKKVEVHVIKGTNRFATLTRFYRIVFELLQRGMDCFFVHMGGFYPILLSPFKLLGKPIYQWKAHRHISRSMRFSAIFCDTKLFTATPNSFPLDLPHKVAVGHGIDTSQFVIKPVPKTESIITTGRIAQVKQLGVMIKALADCNMRYGTSYRLDIYGPVLVADLEYKANLEALIETHNLSSLVSFRGVVPHSQLPNILNRYRLCLNFCKGALGKAALEAMACGLPVLSTNPCVAEILPKDLKELLAVPMDDISKQADHIHQILSLSEEHLIEMGHRLREIVTQQHSVVNLFDKILAEIEACR